MKQRLVVMLVVGLVALGCGGGVAQSPAPQGSQPGQSSAPSPAATQAPASYRPSPAADPVAAVNAALDALVAKNWAAMPGLVCSAERASIANLYDPALQTLYPREATQGLVDALVVRIANRSVALISSTTETATVKLGGTLTEKVSDDALQAFVAALAGGATSSPTKDQLDRASKMFKESISSIILSPEVQVVAEGGGWLLCSDVVTTRPVQSDTGVQGAATPTPAATDSIVPVPAADPVAAVNAVLDAMSVKQWDKLPALMCAEMRGTVSDLSGGLAGPEGKQLMDAMTIDLANRKVTLGGKTLTGVPWRQSVDVAWVDVDGQLSLRVPDEAISALLSQVAAGQSPDPSAMSLQEQVAGMQAILQSFKISPQLAVAHESGGWLVCSSVLSYVDAPSPSRSP